MQKQPGGERRAGPSSITICPARATSNLLRRPAGAVPTTGSSALKHAAPAVSPALAAIVAAVEASISTLLLDDRAPAQGVENGEYPDYVTDHLTLLKFGMAGLTTTTSWSSNVLNLQMLENTRLSNSHPT
jgi:hypothetical protein